MPHPQGPRLNAPEAAAAKGTQRHHPPRWDLARERCLSRECYVDWPLEKGSCSMHVATALALFRVHWHVRSVVQCVSGGVGSHAAGNVFMPPGGVVMEWWVRKGVFSLGGGANTMGK